MSLRDEVALIEPVFERAGEPFALVGHSYGGAIAPVAAIAQPRRVGALALLKPTLFEPTLFAPLAAELAPPNEDDGIREAVNAADASLDAGDANAAAVRFITYRTIAGFSGG